MSHIPSSEMAAPDMIKPHLPKGSSPNQKDLAIFSDLKGVFIKQKPQYCEGCFERKNEYKIFKTNANGDTKGSPIMMAKEDSNCLTRQCCLPVCRQVKINVKDTATDEEIFKYDKPCAFACLCFCRPEMKVFSKGNQIGSVTDPWSFCDYTLRVNNKEGEKKYDIVGNCCQLGLCCQAPCEPCQTVHFDVKDASGQKISHISKKTAGCVKAALTDADNFQIDFPQDASLEDKALLMASAVLMDYMFFEEKEEKQNQN